MRGRLQDFFAHLDVLVYVEATIYQVIGRAFQPSKPLPPMLSLGVDVSWEATNVRFGQTLQKLIMGSFPAKMDEANEEICGRLAAGCEPASVGDVQLPGALELREVLRNHGLLDQRVERELDEARGDAMTSQAGAVAP